MKKKDIDALISLLGLARQCIESRQGQTSLNEDMLLGWIEAMGIQKISCFDVALPRPEKITSSIYHTICREKKC